MIVSASYRSDIPAFYGQWFLERLRAGEVAWRNPYSGAVHRLPLTCEAVEGFVFWTRNPTPFLPVLKELAEAGWPFVLQVTITGYPRALEASVPAPERVLPALQEIRRRYGPHCLVWRYDPVFLSDLTPPNFHRAQLAELAERFGGLSDEVVLSFAQIYAKTRRNSDAAARRHGFDWTDPPAAEKQALLGDLGGIARAQGFRPTLCSQPDLLGAGLEPARCIDAERLSAVAGRPIAARKKGNRPGCLCAESRDIGAYDTCPHGCVYCYAVRAPQLAKTKHAAQDPKVELLGG
ncbi:DUF1848 domain-containing protein [Aquibaculum arenosum]|uniref:DUF1848 domain-containing protein n=1 Tax=Aquibaculum arenosum TaxID=3032591 RepID=A0ABT5YHT9_9PROT|nr:DUF1848 domain-containing protein [Fodinicurvata sp. CAU 1616]MDF2094502.1 DUF1848 domain-containing protein [Fodinicurvata sp. CAU 1616]